MALRYIEVFLSIVRDNQIVQVALTAVLLLMLLDVIFGVANAILHKEFSSEKMRHGIAHKCASFGFMLVGIIVDGCILGGFDLGYTAPVLTAICAYLAIMEIASLLETFCKMNPAFENSALFKLLASVQVIKEAHED